MSPTLMYKKDGVFTSTGGGGGVTVDPYVRPADWLALPTVLSSDQKFVGLHAVYNHESNFVAVNCAGAYTVDWGDGVVENFATGVQANHNYVYSALGSGTLSTRGYRQAVVTITPQAGQNLTTVNLLLKHSQTGLVNGYASGWLDIRMAGSLVSTLTIASSSTSIVRHRMLEQFEYVGTSAVTTCANKFQNCAQLRSLIGTAWTASVTNFSSMFTGCSSLQTIPLLNTAAGTNFGNMFNACSSLQTIPLINTAAGTGAAFNAMFTGCSSLQTIPLLNTAAGTNFASMFANCYSLQTIPLLNTVAGTTFSSMFNACSSLQTIPLLNTGAGLDFSSMFNACSSLHTLPLLNTAAGQAFNNMFVSCVSLREIPLLNTAAGTAFNAMFTGCSSLQTIPLLNTGAGTNFASMFDGCIALQTVPLLNTAAGTTFTGMFTGCASLRVGAMAGTSKTISYASCALGPAALDAIYTNLATLNNMLSLNAASAETSVADWSTNVANCTISRGSVGPAAPEGSSVVRMTSVAAGVTTAAITARIPVSPSTEYTFLVKASAASGGARPGRVAVDWYDAGGALLSTSTGADVTLPVNSYSQVIVTATSPPTAATASLILSATVSGANHVTDWDTMGLFLGATTVWVPPAGSQTITVTGNWGVASDTPSIATGKGWTVTG